MSVSAMNRGVSETIGTFAGAGVGPGYTLPVEGIGARIAWQVVASGAPTSLTVLLEGSLDGENWQQMDTTSATGGYLNVLDHLSVAQIRAHVTVLSGGSSPEITVLARTQ